MFKPTEFKENQLIFFSFSLIKEFVFIINYLMIILIISYIFCMLIRLFMPHRTCSLCLQIHV